MTIKYLTILMTILSSFSLMASGNSEHQKMKEERHAYKIDNQKSSLKWTATKLTGKHYGNVSLKGGQIEMKNGRLVGGEFLIDMNSITVTDGTSGEWLKKLINHLKNDDFFSVARYPVAKLKIKNSILGKGGAFDVSGELTIKGITKPILFSVDVEDQKKEVIARTFIVFNRLDFGIKYNSAKFFSNLGDKLIHDKVKVGVKIIAKK